MKIAILTDRKTLGGVEKIAIKQAKELRKLGVDAQLVMLRREDKLEENFKDLLIDVPQVYLDDRLPAFLRKSIKLPVFHFFSLFHITYPLLLPFVVKQKEFDYIVVHGTFTSFSAITLRLFNGIPFSAFIWDPIGYILDRVYSRSFHPFIFSTLKILAKGLDGAIIWLSDSILVGGSAHNDYFKSIKNNVIINVVPPAVDPPKSRRAKVKKKQILLVTAWKKGKKAEYLIELLKKIPKVPVKMVGAWISEEYLNEIKLLFKKHNLLSQIKIVGGVSEKELSRYYQESLVFLQINDDRGFGMPALESAANGTTFVIPQGQGVCELFSNNQEGFFVEETNTSQIARILKSLLREPRKASQMGLRAAKKSKNYYWRSHAEHLQTIITNQLKEQNAAKNR